MTKSNNDVALNIKATVLGLLIKKPFFGFIVSKMKFIEDKDAYIGPIPTAATDGKNIFYNTDFFNSLQQEERMFVVAHEIMHCVLDSFGRRHDRDAQYWNMATDYAINNLLQIDQVGKMPSMALYDRKYADYSAEMIYEDLVKNQAQKKDTLDVHIEADGSGQDNNEDGSGSPDNSGNPGDKKSMTVKVSKKQLDAAKDEFKKLLVEAYQRAKMAGSEMGGIELMVGELLTPKINWKNLLITSIQSLFKNDITWTVPKRRNPVPGMILPSMRFDETVDICVSIDTSGSISEEQRKEFLSEISGILNYYKSFKLKIWCFDTAVHNMQEYDQYSINDLINYQPAGGGGTDIKCNFDFMQEEGIKPKQFVCLTDGYNFNDNWGPEDYCPTTWIIHSNPKPHVPFGRWAIFEELVSE